MEPKIIVARLDGTEIDSEKKAQEIMKFAPEVQCSLIHLVEPAGEHLLWVGNDSHFLKIKPVFNDDFIPKSFDQIKVSFLKDSCFFTFREKLYFLLNSDDGLLITYVSVFNCWKEIDILLKKPDSIKYICKAYHISDNKSNARKFVGYCWRVVNDRYIYTFPFFPEDFLEIKKYPLYEMDYEAMDVGEKFFHQNTLWTVYQEGEKQFFANPNLMTLHLCQR